MTEQKDGLPNGKYTFVGIDVDATGRRILDEVNFCAKKKKQTIFRLSVLFLSFTLKTRGPLTRYPLANQLNRFTIQFCRLFIWPLTHQLRNTINTLFL